MSCLHANVCEELIGFSLQLREGGVDEAIQALPRVRNHTLGHVAVYSLSKKLKDNGKQAVRSPRKHVIILCGGSYVLTVMM